MKKFAKILLASLLAALLLLGLVLPAFADDEPVLLIATASAPVYTATYEDATYAASPDNADDSKVYYLTITSDAPAEVLAKVTYTIDGKPFNGASEPGSYTVTATLPEGQFVDASGNPVTTLTATLTLTKNGLSTDIPGKPYGVILRAKAGLPGAAKITNLAATIPENLLKKFAGYETMAFRVSGTEGAEYILLVPVNSDLYAAKRGRLPNRNSLYHYVDGKLVSLAKEDGVTVSYSEGHFEVTGLKGDTEMTIVVAVKKAPCLWWIWVLLFIIVVLICFFFMGRYKAKQEAKQEAEEKAAAKKEKKQKKENTPDVEEKKE